MSPIRLPYLVPPPAPPPCHSWQCAVTSYIGTAILLLRFFAKLHKLRLFISSFLYLSCLSPFYAHFLTSSMLSRLGELLNARRIAELEYRVTWGRGGVGWTSTCHMCRRTIEENYHAGSRDWKQHKVVHGNLPDITYNRNLSQTDNSNLPFVVDNNDLPRTCTGNITTLVANLLTTTSFCNLLKTTTKCA
jgi:hypothetical protein